MATPGRPPGQVRRSGRVRTPTTKAQNHEHDEEISYGENAEGDESDAMEGITMFSGEPVGSVIGANEHALEPLTTAYVERTGTEAMPQRQATNRDQHRPLARRIEGKRTGNAVKTLTDLVRALFKEMKDQNRKHESTVEGLRQALVADRQALMSEIEGLQARVAELTDTINNRPSNIDGTSPRSSYAEVAATPPHSQPSNIRTLTSTGSTRSHGTDTLHCIIDTSRVSEENARRSLPAIVRQAIEAEMRTQENHTHWRCAAVVRDARNAKHIKIACRDGNKLMKIKESASKALSSDFRTLRDQLFPIKVDNTNRTAVLDQEG